MKKKVCHQKISGLTLFEALLVLVIGSSILILGINQYQSFRQDADLQQLKYNVDMIFSAASRYYQANCSRKWNPTTGPVAGTGTLDPASGPTNPFPVTVQSLRDNGYLTANTPLNPLVNNDGVNGGYIVQFNRVTPGPNRMVAVDATTSLPVGEVVTWKVQVAVELYNPDMANAYQAMLNANCTSTISGSSVTPCTGFIGVGTTPNYLVWERLPSLAVSGVDDSLWLTNPTLEQFKQMYTTLPINYLLQSPSSQNYLCGN